MPTFLCKIGGPLVARDRVTAIQIHHHIWIMTLTLGKIDHVKSNANIEAVCMPCYMHAYCWHIVTLMQNANGPYGCRKLPISETVRHYRWMLSMHDWYKWPTNGMIYVLLYDTWKITRQLWCFKYCADFYVWNHKHICFFYLFPNTEMAQTVTILLAENSVYYILYDIFLHISDSTWWQTREAMASVAMLLICIPQICISNNSGPNTLSL